VIVQQLGATVAGAQHIEIAVACDARGIERASPG
jgi:hypothetical protein